MKLIFFWVIAFVGLQWLFLETPIAALALGIIIIILSVWGIINKSVFETRYEALNIAASISVMFLLSFTLIYELALLFLLVVFSEPMRLVG